MTKTNNNQTQIINELSEINKVLERELNFIKKLVGCAKSDSGELMATRKEIMLTIDDAKERLQGGINWIQNQTI